MRFLLLFFLGTCISVAQTPPDPLRTSDWEAQNQWVDSLYHQMTLDEKIGQLFMVMAFSEKDDTHFQTLMEQIETYHLGGVIFSLGGPVRQTQWLNQFQEKAKIPLLIGMDAEWGVAMRLDSVRPFPWNMTLGAIQDNRLVEAIGKRIGEQAHRLGVHINFAPDVDINTNPINPIIGNRSFGESKTNVAQKGVAFMNGMHRAGVLSSAKHFPGHGDTAKDSHLDLPLIRFSEDRLRSTELFPFQALIDQGVASVMVAHLNVPAFDSGIPSSLSKTIVDSLLVQQMKFKGLIITDALNMGGASEVSKVNSIDVAAFLAGNDVLLIPNSIKKAIKKMKRSYKQRRFSEKRLAHSVKKILRAKYKVGLHQRQRVPLTHLIQDLNTTEDDYLIKKAMESALTLLKDDGVLPLQPTDRIGHLSLGEASAAPFIQGLSENISITPIDFSGSISSTLDAVHDLDKVVISFHRSNATPWKAADLSSKQRQLVQALAKQKKVIFVPFVKPYALSKLDQLNSFACLLVGYQNNKEAQLAAVDVLLGKQGVNGKLPVSIAEAFPVGSGLTIELDQPLQKADPFTVGIDAQKLKALDTLAQVVLDSMMAPGMQILAARKGKIVYHKAFGHHTYRKQRPVVLNDVYDLASLTKILATLPLLIQEVEGGTMTFSSTLGELSSRFIGSNKDSLTFKEVLSHQSGIVPFIPFYKNTLRRDKPQRKYYRKDPSKRFDLGIASRLYGRSSLADKQYQALIDTPLLSKGYHYSDLPLIFMQHILEERYGLPLDELIEMRFYRPLGLNRTFFNPLDHLQKTEIIPTENDSYFRYQELHGFVNDETAALQGGVSGNAGLFSTAYEVGVLMQLLLQKGHYAGQTYFGAPTFDQFNQCHYCDRENRRGVGLDKPQLWGGGMAFAGISPTSFGHSGFTGNLVWADPVTETVFVFLSNRTYPSRKNEKLITHSIRTRMLKLFHDAIIF